GRDGQDRERIASARDAAATRVASDVCRASKLLSAHRTMPSTRQRCAACRLRSEASRIKYSFTIERRYLQSIFYIGGTFAAFLVTKEVGIFCLILSPCCTRHSVNCEYYLHHVMRWRVK